MSDHILLGGDNMDMALARHIEHVWQERLDTQRFFALVQHCRTAKETLLGASAPPVYALSLPGRGRGVIAGTLAATLQRDHVIQQLLEGFFPLVPFDAALHSDSAASLGEWGMPFAADPAVSRYLAAFLRSHAAGEAGVVWPDAILFNGGALKPKVAQQRLAGLVRDWRGSEVRVLESVDLDLAVARGAAYYGVARVGKGVRIGGGTARTYYLGIHRDTVAPTDAAQALCVVQRGMEEGEAREFAEVPLAVITNRAVSFPLFASSVRSGDTTGSIVLLRRDEVSALPPIRTVLRFGKKLEAREIPVHLAVRLTEVGTLELWCISRTTPHRWRLQFDLRNTNLPQTQSTAEASELNIGAEQATQALALLEATFPLSGPSCADPVRVVRQLEELLGAGKDVWPLSFLRQAWDVLWEGREARKMSPEHEARWYNLAGFFLRPGFGAPGDPVRVDRLWRLRSEGIRFAKSIQVRAEWWNLWKRVAGGLQRTQQQQLFNDVSPYLLSRLQKKREKLPKVGPQEVREYWQLVASCELLTAEQKEELGDALLAHVVRGKATAVEIWALGRLGARAPMYGPLNCVVRAAKAAVWAGSLASARCERGDAVAFALVQLARCVGDRERDLPHDLRERLASWLESHGSNRGVVRLLREAVPIETSERARILDESLPVGLVWSADTAAS